MEAVMETDPLLWMPGSFDRRPEWRWLRAGYRLAVLHKRDSRFDDCWVDEARLALRGSSKTGSSAAAVQAAHKLWTGDPVVRGELEAFLLTDLQFDEIAKRCGLPLATVEAYEAVFFAVRSMLRATDKLFAKIIEYRPWSGFTGPMPASAWKLAAFTGGPLILELVIAATTGQPLPANFFKKAVHQGAAFEKYVRQLTIIWLESMDAVNDEKFAAVIRSRRSLRKQYPQFVDLGEPLSEAVVTMEEFLMHLPSRINRGRKPGSSKRACDGVSPYSASRGNGQATRNVPSKAEKRAAKVVPKTKARRGKESVPAKFAI